MCRAAWTNDYDLKEVLVCLNATSSRERRRLLEFFFASRHTETETWWRMADFKIELIRRVVPEKLVDRVLDQLAKQEELHSRGRMLWFEDSEHQEELAKLKAMDEALAQEIETELEGSELVITDDDIVATFRALGWDG